MKAQDLIAQWLMFVLRLCILLPVEPNTSNTRKNVAPLLQNAPHTALSSYVTGGPGVTLCRALDTFGGVTPKKGIIHPS